MKKYIGDKAFYKMLFAVSVPIMIQNGITSFVNLLDNLMIGSLGTLEMSGVAIANQLLFVFNLCIFGGVSGAGIFTAQYYGNKDDEGVRYTFRYKFFVALFLVIAAIGVFTFFDKPLLSLFLTGEGTALEKEMTLGYAQEYLKIMLIQIVPFAVAQLYASTLRECGNTKIPMQASIVSVFTNFVLNWVFIYGHFGFPAMGVKGAAIATVIARFAELSMVAISCIRNRNEFTYLHGVLKSLYIPKNLVKSISIKGMPLLANEFMWSFGMSTLMQCYSTRGLDVVAATNITSTITNIFNIVFFAFGNSLAIIVGQMLGANEIEKAKDTDRKVIACAIAGAVVFGVLLIICSPFLPSMYNTTDSVKDIATILLVINAIVMPIHAYNHCGYFTLRSGGKTGLTVLLDCGFMWVVTIPIAMVIANFTSLNIFYLFFICQAVDIIKLVICYFFLKKGTWAVNIVE